MSPQMVITCLSSRHISNVVILTLKRLYPSLAILARAVDIDHQKRLQKTVGVSAMVPILPENSFLLNLPFGGAVLKSLGYPSEEVDAILEDIRKKAVDDEEEGAAIEVQGEDEAVHVVGHEGQSGTPHMQEVAYETKESKSKKEQKAATIPRRYSGTQAEKINIDSQLELEMRAAVEAVLTDGEDGNPTTAR